MSDENQGIITPSTMPVIVVVIGALALLSLTLNFYNWSQLQTVTGASLALTQNAARANTPGQNERLQALETEVAQMKTTLDAAMAKMAQAETMAAEGMAAGGAMDGEMQEMPEGE